MNRKALISAILDNMQTVKRGMFGHFQHQRALTSLSPSQMEIFFTIKHLQPTGTKQLAEQLHLTPGAISQVVDGLVQLGFVERQTDNLDRRKQFLRLSTAGEAHSNAIKKHRADMFKQILAVMSDEELAQWNNIQKKIIKQLEKFAETNKT